LLLFKPLVDKNGYADRLCSVSAVHGMGKIKWLSTVQNGDRYLSALSLLGSDLIIEQTTFETIEKLFFSLYGN